MCGSLNNNTQNLIRESNSSINNNLFNFSYNLSFLLNIYQIKIREFF